MWGGAAGDGAGRAKAARSGHERQDAPHTDTHARAQLNVKSAITCVRRSKVRVGKVSGEWQWPAPAPVAFLRACVPVAKHVHEGVCASGRWSNEVERAGTRRRWREGCGEEVEGL